MKKLELQELKSGDYVQSVKTGEVLEVVGMDAEAGKYMLSNGKVYSKSTIERWWNIAVVEPLVEDNTEEQDTTADTEEQQDTDTTATTATNIQVNELHEDAEQTTKTHTTEGNTATTNTAKTNTVQPTIQQRNLMTDISNLVDLHGANLIQRKEYIGVYKEGYKGCIAMISRAKYGGVHIDMKQKIWNALDEDYKKVVSKEHYTGIYDKSRKLFRIGYVSDLDILEVVICTALQLVS